MTKNDKLRLGQVPIRNRQVSGSNPDEKSQESAPDYASDAPIVGRYLPATSATER